MKFVFENLDVYVRAVSFATNMNNLCQTLKGKIPYSTIDQLLRASLSISLNIAEGNGRWHIKEKKQFFWISRGSLFETIPILQVIRNTGNLSDPDYGQYYEEVRTMSKMMTNLIKSVDNLGSHKSQ